jgi:hypothetical protein
VRDEVASLVDALVRAIGRAAEVARDRDPVPDRQIDAVRELVAAVDDVVASDLFWTRLRREALDATWTSSGNRNARTQLERLARLMDEWHVNLLEECGYRHPPQPVVDRLVSRTRDVILPPRAAPIWTRQRVNGARRALEAYADAVRQHIDLGTG